MSKLSAYLHSVLFAFGAYMMVALAVIEGGPLGLLRGSPHPVLAGFMLSFFMVACILAPVVILSEHQKSLPRLALLVLSVIAMPMGVIALAQAFPDRNVKGFAIAAVLLACAAGGLHSGFRNLRKGRDILAS